MLQCVLSPWNKKKITLVQDPFPLSVRRLLTCWWAQQGPTLGCVTGSTSRSGACFTTWPKKIWETNQCKFRQNNETLIDDITLPEHDSPPLGCDCADLRFLGTYNGDISAVVSSQYIPESPADCSSYRCKETFNIYCPIRDMNKLKQEKYQIYMTWRVFQAKSFCWSLRSFTISDISGSTVFQSKCNGAEKKHQQEVDLFLRSTNSLSGVIVEAEFLWRSCCNYIKNWNSRQESSGYVKWWSMFYDNKSCCIDVAVLKRSSNPHLETLL